MSKSTRHIPSLDGLRAVSFLLVFAAHAGLEHFVPGGFGVTIFFFLSGFLITTLLRAEFEKNGVISIRHFWLRRTLRSHARLDERAAGDHHKPGDAR